MGKSRILGTAMVGLVGAIIGSFSMMLFASTHFANVAGPNNQPPSVIAAPLGQGVSDQERIVSAVKRVSPSVVQVIVTANGQQVVPADPFAPFFGGPQGPQVRNFQERGSGSGFIYSKSGLIITNAHVVNWGQGISKIDVVFNNGDRVPAHLYSANSGQDLALIKVDNYAKLPAPLELGDSDRLQAGQWAIAIGEPFSLKQTVTVGVVSGFNRSETIGGAGHVQEYKGLLQTSAAINPGNSGGPLVDIEGRLIGVNSATANPQMGAQGIGFAIPVNTVRTQVALLEKEPAGTVTSGTNAGYIGVLMAPITENVRTQLNYKGTGGVAIANVVSGSPADEAGLQPGDVILKVNGKDVTAPDQVSSVIKGLKPGTTLNLQVWSSGIKKLANVKVAERPAGLDFQAPGQQQP